MRIYEITDDDEIVLRLLGIDPDYHNNYRRYCYILEDYAVTGEPVPQDIIDRVRKFQNNLLQLKASKFDDPDWPQTLKEPR